MGIALIAATGIAVAAAAAAIYYIFMDIQRVKKRCESLAFHMKRIEGMILTYNIRRQPTFADDSEVEREAPDHQSTQQDNKAETFNQHNEGTEGTEGVDVVEGVEVNEVMEALFHDSVSSPVGLFAPSVAGCWPNQELPEQPRVEIVPECEIQSFYSVYSA
jgi:hypothetical protein